MEGTKKLTPIEEKKQELFHVRKNGYDRLEEGEELAITNYCEGYKAFLDAGKIERECVAYAIELRPRASGPWSGARSSSPAIRSTATTAARLSCSP